MPPWRSVRRVTVAAAIDATPRIMAKRTLAEVKHQNAMGKLYVEELDLNKAIHQSVLPR